MYTHVYVRRSSHPLRATTCARVCVGMASSSSNQRPIEISSSIERTNERTNKERRNAETGPAEFATKALFTTCVREESSIQLVACRLKTISDLHREVTRPHLYTYVFFFFAGCRRAWGRAGAPDFQRRDGNSIKRMLRYEYT